MSKIVHNLDEGKSEDEKLLMPIYYVESTPVMEKTVDIKKLMSAYNTWLQIPEEKLQNLQEFFCLMNNADLVVKNLPDELNLPAKGYKKSQDVFGMPLTVNSLGLGRVKALDKIYNLLGRDQFEKYLRRKTASYKTCSQLLFWRDDLKCPTEKEYLDLCIYRKDLFLEIFDLMMLFSNGEFKQDFSRIAGLLAQIFQLREDYLDLTDKNIDSNYISEGKFLFPFVHAVQNGLDNGRIMKMFGKRDRNGLTEEYLNLLTLLKEVGSLDYTIMVIKKLVDEVEEELNRFDANSALLEFIRQSCVYF